MNKNSLARFILNDDEAVVGVKEHGFELKTSSLPVDYTTAWDCYDENFKITRLNNTTFYLFVSSGVKGWTNNLNTSTSKLFFGPCFVELSFDEMATLKLQNHKSINVVLINVPTTLNKKIKLNVVAAIVLMTAFILYMLK